MRKITKTIIAVFAIATMFVSCSKDEPSSSTDTMIGNWSLDNIVATEPGTTPQSIDINGSCAVKNYFDIKAGGILENGQLDINSCHILKVNGTWKKMNNSMEIILNTGEEMSFIVQSATASKLVLRMMDLGPGIPEGAYADFNYSKK